MNKQRRTEIEILGERIMDLKFDVERLRDEEVTYLEAMLHKGGGSRATIDLFDSAITGLEDATDALEEIRE